MNIDPIRLYSGKHNGKKVCWIALYAKGGGYEVEADGAPTRRFADRAEAFAAFEAARDNQIAARRAAAMAAKRAKNTFELRG